MNPKCSGVILAGGLSSRFFGIDKALIRVRGKRILDNIYNIFNELFEEIILVTNEPARYLEWDFKIVADLFPVRSSLTGIHAGLFFTTAPFAFIAACDTPFLKKGLVETIISGIEPGIDVVVPETSAGLEPLCAVYSRTCLNSVEHHILKQQFKIRRLFNKLKIKIISEKNLIKKDAALLSFYNINTPDELAKAEAIIL